MNEYQEIKKKKPEKNVHYKTSGTVRLRKF